jgi:hypothetical protein
MDATGEQPIPLPTIAELFDGAVQLRDELGSAAG